MYNCYLTENEINIKVGDRVISHGYTGTVTKVYRGCDKQYNQETRKYEPIPGKEFTQVRIHFDEDTELIRNGYLQYQDGEYGEFWKLQ